ncbi:MAG TPA: thiamine pyrophosphate-dependent dehydrogenase E1 component subunit alpha [Candidatus Krumholzibacteria bacterium]|nr:thiamine pyrophosphate-dependent dehydrogenase E1 component subunit alpha [Candidatus Krumholzibacteria bacterium]
MGFNVADPVPPLLRHTTARLGKKQLLELYRYMILTRMTEDRLSKLYRQGQVVGGLYSSLGQEAVAVGTAYALEKGDRMGALIRNLGSLMVKGVRPREIFTQYLARATSPSFGRDGNTHFGSIERDLVAPISMLGAMIPVLAGTALAAKLRGTKKVAMNYIGDGGASTGDFHEGLNLAAVWKLPLILVCENNGYAYSTPTASQTRNPRFADRAKAYGIKGERVDGNDVIAVYHSTARAVRRCRKGEGPILLEMLTFRRRGHAEHDDAGYVPHDLRRYWEARDPIDRLRNYLLGEGLVTQPQLDEMRDPIAKELEEDAEYALNSPMPDPSLAFGGVYAEDHDPRLDEREEG